MFAVLSGGQDKVAYSANGIDWKDSKIDIGKTSVGWESICYGNGKFIAVGSTSFGIDQTAIAAYSDDGIIWKPAILPNPVKSSYWISVCYGNGKFVAVGSRIDPGYTVATAYSPDGIHWTESGDSFDGSYSFVCYGNGKFIAIGSEDTSGYNKIPAYSTSANGIDWEPMTAIGIGIENSDGGWSGISYGKGRYVCIFNYGTFPGPYTSFLEYSVNGRDWLQRELPQDEAENVNGICYGAGKFVAVGSIGAYPYISTGSYSKDGVYWTKIEFPAAIKNNSCILRAGSYGHDKFVIIGFNTDTLSTVAAYSKDGVNWAMINIPNIGGAGSLTISYGSDNDIFGFL
jgi:hypothetical protein